MDPFFSKEKKSWIVSLFPAVLVQRARDHHATSISRIFSARVCTEQFDILGLYIRVCSKSVNSLVFGSVELT